MEIDQLTVGSGAPIEFVGRRLACENTKFFVYFDHLVDQSGLEVKDYLVIAPKVVDSRLVTGVGILPIVEGSVALVRIYRPALRAYSLEIPQGFTEEGESDDTAASRELLEETGLTVDPCGLSSLGYVTPDSGVLAARAHLYVADRCSRSDGAVRELGLREILFFGIHDFEKMIADSEIQDSFTLAAWCRYRLIRF